MKRAIIFDFDGVLADTHDLSFKIAQLLSSKEITKQDFADHHRGNVFEKPVITLDIKKSFSFSQKHKELFTGKNFFPVENLLIELEGKFQLFIISSAEDENIRHYLGLKNYNNFFTKILGSTTHKSKVQKFKMVFDEFELTPKECLFVTDTTGDIIEAKSIDVDTIAVSWGYHDEKLLMTENPFAIAHSPEELLKIINSVSDKFSN